MTTAARRVMFVSLWFAIALGAAAVANSTSQGQRAGLSAFAPAPVAAQSQSISKVIVVAAGIDPLQSNPQSCPPISSFSGCYDAYDRASSTFQPVLSRLGCALTPSQSTPLVGCSDGTAWVPFSYAGLANGRPLPYTGAQTGQPLAQSAARMTELVQAMRARPEVGNAPIVIVAHSLGGAVSTYWGASNQDVPVLTFDSPVNGIWSTDVNVSNVYCNASVGLFTYIQAESCNLLFFVPAATSAAVDDLRQQATIQRMGQARQLNFASTLDAFVPSWFAVARTQTLGAVLKPSSCTYVTDPIFNHFCIITSAAPEAAAFIASGTLPPPTPIRQSTTLSISASVGGTPVDGTVTAKRLGQVVARAQTSDGTATLSVPWMDVLLEFSYGGGTMQLGSLPGSMTDLSLSFAAWTTPPTKTCTPVSPAAGAETVCVLTLTGQVNSGVIIQDTVTSPAGSRVTACTGSNTLVCIVNSRTSAEAQCSLFVISCPAGSTVTLRITGGAPGPLAESVEFTPNAGSTPVLTFPLAASPSVTFGQPAGSRPDGSHELLQTLESILAAIRPGTSLAALIQQVQQQVEGQRGPVACGLLKDVFEQIRAHEQAGLITRAEARQLIADGARTYALLGCV